MGDTDSTKPVVTFLTWLLLSDLPPHRFPDVCRWCALTYRLGNRFPFHRSWQQWFSQCWQGTSPSWPGKWNLPLGYRARHTYRTKFINRVFIHILKTEYFNWMDNLKVRTRLWVRDTSWSDQTLGEEPTCTRVLSGIEADIERSMFLCWENAFLKRNHYFSLCFAVVSSAGSSLGLILDRVLTGTAILALFLIGMWAWYQQKLQYLDR